MCKQQARLRALGRLVCGQGYLGRDTQFLGLGCRSLGAIRQGVVHCPWVLSLHPAFLPEFQPTIQPGFWKLPHAWTSTDASMVYPTFEPQDSFSEERSDSCLVQLLGTGWAPYTCPHFPKTQITCSLLVLLSPTSKDLCRTKHSLPTSQTP